MYWAWVVIVLPFAVISFIVYCAVLAKGVPDEVVSVTVPELPLAIVTGAASVQLVPSTVPEFIVTDEEPVFWMVHATLPPVLLTALLASTVFDIDACSEFPMNPMVRAPIHAATTTLTATVTAMSMIVAITGLSAFAFFLNFLNFSFFTLLWVSEYNVPLLTLINIMT